MNVTKYGLFVALMLVSPLAAVPAAAQEAAVTVGMEVRGPGDDLVGQVKSVDGDHIVVATDRNEARLPTSSFTPHEGKLLFAMTRDQLNAEVDKAKAAASASLVPGAVVNGAGGARVGAIDAIDASFVTIKLDSGQLVKLPRASIGVGANGPMISLTMAELQAAVSQ